MRNFQDTSETRERSFISAFSICMTVRLTNLHTLRVNNSIILRIQNAKCSEYCFYMNTNIERDFQICISVPLMEKFIFVQCRDQYLNCNCSKK